MRLIKSTIILLLISLLPFLVGCSQSNAGSSSASQTACAKQSTIRGNIVTISHAPAGSTANFLGGILIDGTKEQKAAYDKVYASILTGTQIFEKQGQACRSASLASLKIGQRVQIQATGGAMMSYPPQIDATEIVILPPGA